MTMPVPTGRCEKRIGSAVAVEICLQDEPMLTERVWTENVSAHGRFRTVRPSGAVGKALLAVRGCLLLTIFEKAIPRVHR
jgi:hypothetical protein